MKTRLPRLRGWIAVIVFASTLFSVAVGDETVLRRVASAVVEKTTRCLVDGRTGRTLMDSGELQPAPEIRIESKFNAWFYQTWLLADGMRRTAGALDEPAFLNYGERNLDFIYQHMAFFEKQHAAGMRDGSGRRWQVVPDRLLFQNRRAVAHRPRTAGDGALCRNEGPALRTLSGAGDEVSRNVSAVRGRSVFTARARA